MTIENNNFGDVGYAYFTYASGNSREYNFIEPLTYYPTNQDLQPEGYPVIVISLPPQVSDITGLPESYSPFHEPDRPAGWLIGLFLGVFLAIAVAGSLATFAESNSSPNSAKLAPAYSEPPATQTPLPPTATAAPACPIHHTVRSGDSASQLAKDYKTTMEKLLAANKERITNPNYIEVGWVLTIPCKE